MQILLGEAAHHLSATDTSVQIRLSESLPTSVFRGEEVKNTQSKKKKQQKKQLPEDEGEVTESHKRAGNKRKGH